MRSQLPPPLLLSLAPLALFVSACFEPFPELPPLMDSPPPDTEPPPEDAMLLTDLAPLIEDMMVDMSLDQDMEPLIEMDMMELDAEVIIDMTPDMEVRPVFAQVTAVTCDEEGFIITETEERLEGGGPCPSTLSSAGREWLRVSSPAGVGFNLSVSDVPFNQISDVSTPAVYSQMMSPYFLMRREVSLEDYARCVAAGSCDAHDADVLADAECLVNQAGVELDRYPVNCVSWSQAQAFCEWAGGQLPSEMEWELAVTLHREVFPVPWSAEQGSPEFQRYISVASGLLDSFCAYSNYGNCSALNPQGLSARPSCYEYPEGAGLPPAEYLDGRLFCDASGNLAEWTLDDYDVNVTNVPASGEPTTRGDDIRCVDQPKVTRGGSYLDLIPGPGNLIFELFKSVSYYGRDSEPCATRSPAVGFRCALPYSSP